jgi:hypothetical protein
MLKRVQHDGRVGIIGFAESVKSTFCISKGA